MEADYGDITENIGPAFDKEYDLGTSAPYNRLCISVQT